jgi:hypothetical protein
MLQVERKGKCGDKLLKEDLNGLSDLQLNDIQIWFGKWKKKWPN